MRENGACAQYRERMWAYLAGELGSPEKTRLQRHLDCCVPCREHMENARQSIALLGHLRQAPLPVTQLGWDDLCRRMDAAKRPAAILNKGPRIGFMAACAVGGIIAACWISGGNWPSSHRPSRQVAAIRPGQEPTIHQSTNPPWSQKQTFQTPHDQAEGPGIAEQTVKWTLPEHWSDPQGGAVSQTTMTSVHLRSHPGGRHRTRRWPVRDYRPEAAPRPETQIRANLRLVSAVDGDRPGPVGPPTHFVLASMSQSDAGPVERDYVIGNIDTSVQGAHDASWRPDEERNIW